MRVIVATGLNSGAAEYLNMGDVAMLQAAVVGLRNVWPSARVEVLTDSSLNLARFCPDTTALSRSECLCWIADDRLLGRIHRLLPERISSRADELAESMRLRAPTLVELFIKLKLRLRGRRDELRAFSDFMDRFKQADLLVVAGSGGFSDSCKAWNLSILGTMEAALQRGIPVAMFGQGIGPLTDSMVLARAKRVLPRATFIALRGNRGALALLKSIGVDPTHVVITGDEAIELAYAARVGQAGTAVGINLRVASYAEVEKDDIDAVGSVLQRFARTHDVDLLPVPIALHDHAQDHESIRRLLRGFNDQSDGGRQLDSPLKVIKQVRRCRIVVTGAYHAAVFALAQGIPAICLSSSAYYDSKFEGLIDLFGSGCVIVSPDDAEFPAKLADAMERMYAGAEFLREPLLDASRDQVNRCGAAYRNLQRALNLSGGPSNDTVAVGLSGD